ncbi:MAG: tetratricopeptide repeat protein [Bacteroidetes bacterium]|nr:tetratricopeptide repeat protein [Bacteroidota bacterium]
MKRIALFLLLLAGLTPAFSQDNRTPFDKANLLFKEKKYDAAAKEYEKVVQNGFESAALYFNLGNSYFKMNNIPMAIWYYEKARKLNPCDEDIIFNLKLANTRITDKIESIPELFFYRWWKEIRGLFSPDGWARITIVTFFLFFLLAAIYLLMKKVVIRKISFWLSMTLLLITIFTFTFAWQTSQLRKIQKEAIIFAPAVNVKSSPDESSVDLFVLHEGSKVIITDNLGDWYKIFIANGSVGWIPAETMKVI